MTEVLVWLLVVQTSGTVLHMQTLERFKTLEQCQHVRKELNKFRGVSNRDSLCIQANILMVKP